MDTNNTPKFFARATDSSTGTLREEVGPFGDRDEAEQAVENLRERWALATTFRVVEQA